MATRPTRDARASCSPVALTAMAWPPCPQGSSAPGSAFTDPGDASRLDARSGRAGRNDGTGLRAASSIAALVVVDHRPASNVLDWIWLVNSGRDAVWHVRVTGHEAGAWLGIRALAGENVLAGGDRHVVTRRKRATPPCVHTCTPTGPVR